MNLHGKMVLVASLTLGLMPSGLAIITRVRLGEVTPAVRMLVGFLSFAAGLFTFDALRQLDRPTARLAALVLAILNLGIFIWAALPIFTGR